MQSFKKFGRKIVQFYDSSLLEEGCPWPIGICELDCLFKNLGLGSGPIGTYFLELPTWYTEPTGSHFEPIFLEPISLKLWWVPPGTHAAHADPWDWD